ncbi:MAG TPA: SMC family ATPase [Gemmatimonadales bacterium]
MEIVRLRLINFRQHESTELMFDRGLTGIVGPNGSGKTTLLEAIAYALYGVPGTRGTRDTLRRRGSPPRSRFEVTLEFILGGRRYVVTRSLSSAELRLDNQVLANSTGTVTERVTTLLGMGREEFFNTYFTGQKELAVMAAMGRTERAQFLSRVIGYDRLRDAQDRLRDDRSARRAQLAGIEQGLADPDAIEAEVTQALASLAAAREERAAALHCEQEASDRFTVLAPGWSAGQERRAAWQSLDGERRLIDKRVAVVREQFRAIDQQLAYALQAGERIAALAPAIAEWTTLVAERDLLDRDAVHYAAWSRTTARRDQARGRMAELEVPLDALADAGNVAALTGARAEAIAAGDALDRQLNERRTRWTEDVQEARTKLDALRDRYRELKEQRDLIEQQGPEGICPTCGRPLGAALPGMLALLGRQMDEVQTDGTYYNQRVAQLTDAPQEVRDVEAARQLLDRDQRRITELLGRAQAQVRQREDLEGERRRLIDEVARLDGDLAGPAGEYDASRHEQVRSRLAELEASRREYDQLAGAARRAEALVGEAASAEQRSTAAEVELVAIDQRLGALGWDATVFATLEAAVREAELALHGARIAVQATADQIGRAERECQVALARRADRAAKAGVARALGHQITLLDELDRAFSDLRNTLNLQLRPDLSERTSQLLRDLTAGRYNDVDLDEGYVPTVVEDGEVKPVISGGEEDLVNLALRLAISQLIAERAGQPLSLLILDEIFGALDEERRGSVLALLRALSDRFPQVILITHVEGMRDAFDRVITMSYDVESRITTVREDTPEPFDVAV